MKRFIWLERTAAVTWRRPQDPPAQQHNGAAKRPTRNVSKIPRLKHRQRRTRVNRVFFKGLTKRLPESALGVAMFAFFSSNVVLI
jgi:hypothetical protein